VKQYDLAIAWNWEYDEDYIAGIQRECEQRGVSVFQIKPGNLDNVLENLRNGAMSFHAFYDRASDADEAFLPLVALLRQDSVRVINPHERVRPAIDKAIMHLEFFTHGLHVPHTIILPPYNKKMQIELVSSELEGLGKPFVIKPANTTGGGTGVVLNAQTIQDIVDARQRHQGDKYLLQKKIEPANLDGKRGWFRVYYAFEEIIPCWWDDITHMYSQLVQTEEERFGLGPLRDVMRTIERICKLDFFSSEIAMTADGRFIVVDYVNEICDMRLQSKYRNGAPDAVVKRIEVLISHEVERHVHRETHPEIIERQG
jgi:hypothetical protein